ncbi:MAG: exodeoxyribonuclease V subunit gamma, partial [Desulfobacteraceae bacterium]
HGICANFRFPFPNTFVAEMFRAFMPDLTASAPFEPKTLTWQLMQMLPALADKPGFEALQSYLSEQGDDLKRLQLAGRIADTFDQYLIFRPEMILAWEQGKEDHWQARLWRDLVQGRQDRHRAALARIFLEKLKVAQDRGTVALPERITVFGISALPKFHLHMLQALAQSTQVNLYLMNPCREYWGDILSTREIKRKMSRIKQAKPESGELHFEKGNSLLNSMGPLGRDFFELLHEFDYEEWSQFEEPEQRNLLTGLQADILNLREHSVPPGAKNKLTADDGSVQIHSCHSPMREMEVLRDHLLHFFESVPGLTPREILVMAPDITVYSPYIQAVFDLPKEDPRWMPFSIADQSQRMEGRIIEPFLAILNLCRSRFGVTQVLALLESVAVRKQFALSDMGLTLIRRWIGETRIRWGVNAGERARLGLPEFEENSWQVGLDRLLLGYALPGNEQELFADILPYDRIEGEEAEVLGAFSGFMQCLFEQVKGLEQARNLELWAQTLNGVLDTFFSPDENQAQEMQTIRKALYELAEMAQPEKPVFDAEIDLKAVKWHLEQIFSTESFGRGFITGGVTFCTMLPMRSIPFKVIALLGMSHDAYPRQTKPLSFDLIGQFPRPGDRSRRNDDRYLFLESMLSAREILYISYVGRNIQDNSALPASVLVHELLDYVEAGFDPPDRSIREHLIRQHRLQAFHNEYFQPETNLFSYSLENLEIARAGQGERKEVPPFLSRGLTEPEAEFRLLDLEDLVKFFSHPTRFLLNRRLGLFLDDETELFEEEEAFELKGLEKYQLARDLLNRRLAGRDMREALGLAKAGGRLPPGVLGECLYDDLQNGIERFARHIEPFQKGPALEPLPIELMLGDFKVQGRIQGIYNQGLLRYRYAVIKISDFLKAWLEHLVLNACKTGAYPVQTYLFGLEKKDRETISIGYRFAPVEQSREILTGILEKYRQGLRKPLLFFPQTSFEYGQSVLEKGFDREEALSRARNIWEEDDYRSGERQDPYYARCFGETDPLDREFEDLAVEVFGPLLEHRKKVVL